MINLIAKSTQSLQDALDWALMQLRQSREYLTTVQLHRKEHLGLFLDSRIEDALAKLEEAVTQLECSRCPHAATGELSIGPICDRCAEEFTICVGCGRDVRITDAYETNDRRYHIDCAPYEPYDATEPWR